MKLRPNINTDNERGIVSGLAGFIHRLAAPIQNENEISGEGFRVHAFIYYIQYEFAQMKMKLGQSFGRKQPTYSYNLINCK